MNRYKPQKSTLIIAALAILLCLASITGATLALFTSDLNDGTIGINTTSGNLKVDIVDTSDEEKTLVNDVLDFEIVDAQFEPGAVYYTEGFKVKNCGNIPMNYIIYISEDKSKLDDDFAKAFDVWITNDPDNAKNATPLQEFDGSLDPMKTSETYYLVFRMKESAGNEFQNRTFTGIGITVCAVQGNVDID